MLAQMGHYTSAKAVLDEFVSEPDIKGVVKLEERIASFKALAELKWLIHCGKGQAASELLREIRSVCSASGPDVEFETYLLEIQHLMNEDEFEAAMVSINKKLAGFKQGKTSGE